MNRLFLLPALALALAACRPADAPTPTGDAAVADTPDSGDAMGTGEATVGEPLAPEAEVLPVADVIARAPEMDGETVVVEGTVGKVCQVKGCWLTLQNNAGETFRVAVPKEEGGAYAFTFPMDATGATARLAGTFSVEEESVETLQHMAEDEGLAPEAIEAITEPRRTYVLTASGARLTRA